MKNRQLGFMAVDQYGQTYHIDGGHPRQWLLNYFCRKRAAKMYCDLENGGTRHTGYIIAGLWLKIYAVYQWGKLV